MLFRLLKSKSSKPKIKEDQKSCDVGVYDMIILDKRTNNSTTCTDQKTIEHMRYVIRFYDKEYNDDNCHLLYFDVFTSRDVVMNQWIYLMCKVNKYELIHVMRYTDHSLPPEDENRITKQIIDIPYEMLISQNKTNLFRGSPSDKFVKFIRTNCRVEVNPQIVNMCIEALYDQREKLKIYPD